MSGTGKFQIGGHTLKVMWVLKTASSLEPDFSLKVRTYCEEERNVRIWDLEDSNLKTDGRSGHLFFCKQSKFNVKMKQQISN